jgi:hypothetical protein
MLDKEVMTYYPKGTAPFDTVAAPFVDEDGEIYYFNFDQDEGFWDEDWNYLCSRVEYDKVNGEVRFD